MLHLSHEKLMYNQPIHPTREMILCIQITKGRVDFNGDSALKSPCWLWVLNLWPSFPVHMLPQRPMTITTSFNYLALKSEVSLFKRKTLSFPCKSVFPHLQLIEAVNALAKGSGRPVCRQYFDFRPKTDEGLSVPNIRQWSGPVHG